MNTSDDAHGDVSIKSTPVGGRLNQFVEQWKKVTSDKFILQIVSGLQIEFSEIVNPYYRHSLRFNESEISIIAGEIEKLLEKRVIQKSEHEDAEVVSNIFLRKKKDGKKYRMILNLKPLNTSIEYVHFKMDNLETAKCLVRENCYLASIDLSDAYFTVPLHESCRKFVKFEFENESYEFLAMPQGLACAPRIFTKLMKPVFAQMREMGHTCMGYIDDSLIIGRSYAECENSVKVLLEKLQELGFVISWDKSVLTPVQEIEFLGYDINSCKMTVNLPQKKIEYVTQLCTDLLNNDSVSIRELAQVLGVMTAYCNGMEHGKMHYRNLEKLKVAGLREHRGNFEASISLNEDSRTDCQWWIDNAGKNARIIDHGNPDIVIFSDASSGGLSAIGGWGAVRGTQSTGGQWSVEESELHITALETKAALFALKSLCAEETDVHIQIKSDNTCAISYINEMGGMHSEDCNSIAVELWHWAIDRNIWVSAAFVPGVENIADENSRIFHDETEWKLDEEVFNSIVDLWGMPEIDMFASRLNYQIQKYVSWGPDPNAFSIDAFAMSWSNLFMYLNPPFSLLTRTMQKLERDKGTAILIAPEWRTQPWFTMAMGLLVEQPLLLPGKQKLFYLPYAPQRTHPLKPRMMACLVSGDRCRHKAFLRKQPLLSLNGGETVHRDSTGRILNAGKHIVLNDRLIPFVRL